MENHYFSDEDNDVEKEGQKEDIYSIHKNLDESQPNEDKDIIIRQNEYEDSFKEAFYRTFYIKQKGPFELENEDEDIIHPPIIYDKPVISNVEHCVEKNQIIKEKDDKYYPFTKGQGIVKTLEKIGLTVNFNSSSHNNYPSNISNQIFINSKFKTIDYYIDDKGKKKKQKKKRKFKPDDIRKKIKARFHKVIKNIINAKLKKVNSKKLFDFFPQCFITNITIKLNNNSLNKTYEELIEKNYISNIKIQKDSDIDKYTKNNDVLKYLKDNPEISKNSEFDKIKNMKYIDMLKAYFSSMEFEESIIELYNKKEKIDYIEEYINKALTYVNFFSDNKKILNDTSKIKEAENNNDNFEEVMEEEEEEN